MSSEQLYLYEEIMLLALKNEAGTPSIDFVEQIVAGAVLADLLLTERIIFTEHKKKQVAVVCDTALGDPVLDGCLQQIAESGRDQTLQHWLSRLAGSSNFFHRAAKQLCDRKILAGDEKKILMFFTRKIYPEINPVPEKFIINRIESAIYAKNIEVDPRTAVLISLIYKTGLLKALLGKTELKRHKDRIEEIIQGECTGKVVKKVIEACQMVVVMTAVMPAVLSTVVISG